MEYLAHRVGNGELAIPQHRITTIKNYIRPVIQKDMRALWGNMSYYRRFIPAFAEQSSLLSPAIEKGAPKVVRWTPIMVEAFHHLVGKICNVTTDQFTPQTDASGLGLGAVLLVVGWSGSPYSILQQTTARS